MIKISSIISGMWLALTTSAILHISPTNDFYEKSVPVTLPYRCGIYLQYPSYICRRYVEDIAQVVISQVYDNYLQCTV